MREWSLCSGWRKRWGEEVRRKLDEGRSEAERMAEDARRRIEIQSHEAEKGLEGRIRELAGDIGRRLAGREIRV